jgi:chromosomal replication initiation ATPase DnaA
LTIWDSVLDVVRSQLSDEDFRRWFSPTSYASDSGDRISVWVPSESVRRQLSLQYQDAINQALESLDRADTEVRFIVAGTEEDEEELE